MVKLFWFYHYYIAIESYKMFVKSLEMVWNIYISNSHIVFQHHKFYLCYLSFKCSLLSWIFVYLKQKPSRTSTIPGTIILLLLLLFCCCFFSCPHFFQEEWICCTNGSVRLSPEHIILTLCGVISLNSVYWNHVKTFQIVLIWNVSFLIQRSRPVSHQPVVSKTEINLTSSSIERSL